MSQQKEKADFVKMENINLWQALKGTIFKTVINKLWDIKKIIVNIETGYTSLQWDKCDQQASTAYEENQGTSYKLFCEEHFLKLGALYKSPINLNQDFRYNVIMLNELERQLIHLQERIEYFKVDYDEKNDDLYQKVKGLIEDNYELLKTLLENMASKCLNISHLKTNTISAVVLVDLKWHPLDMIQHLFDLKNHSFN